VTPVAPSARDPLADLGDALAAIARASDGAVAAGGVPFLAQVDLRLDPELVDRAPYPLPLRPTTAWEDGRRGALWLGPDAWLILGPPGDAPAIVRELEDALAGLHRSVVDVSASRVALELSGPARFELLASGCGLDLEPRAWGPGRCASTLVAGVPVVLHERAGGLTGILVRPSHLAHLVGWLADAARALGGWPSWPAPSPRP
jgi:sarcosine oxidase subunit gamma